MAKADYIDMRGEDLLSKAFAGWSFCGFDFPEQGVKDGCTGEKCISKAVPYYLRRKAPNGSWQATPDDVVGLISGHLYFKVTAGEIKASSTSLTVKLKELHMTIRRTKSQLLIDHSGSSILTGDESIHINGNTQWGRPKNIVNLVHALANEIRDVPAFTTKELLDFLTNYRGLTTERLKMLAAELLVDVQAHLASQTGVVVTVEGDASLVGR